MSVAELERKFNPGQLRDPGGEHGGQWIKGPGSAGTSVAGDALKLAGKIDLAPDEKLLSSAKVDGDAGGIRLAVTEQAGERALRLGVGPDGYGKRNRDEGTPAWDGNPSRAALPEAERQRLSAELDALDAEYDSASPTRQVQIDDRLAHIREQLSANGDAFNGTAKLDEYAAGRLADRIRPALAEAVDQAKAENDAWDQIDALEANGNPNPARIAKLRQITDRGGNTSGIVFAEGVVPGSGWGDVHFSVELDDLSVGPFVTLGVTPKGAPDNWGDGKDWQGRFDAAETRKILRLLSTMSGSGVQRAYSQESGPAYQAPAGPPKGGQFAKGGGRVTGKGRKSGQRRPAAGAPKKPTAPDPNLSFDGTRGTGYGIKGGDARVRTLQAALNRLGLTDSTGNELAIDGRYGPRTTSSVMKLQKRLGIPVDGKVTPELLDQVSKLPQLPAKPPSRRRTPKAASSRTSRRRVRRSDILAAVARTLGECHVVDGICVTCGPAEDDEAVRALADALDEISRVRYVRTEAGAKKYGVPIGTPIGGGGSHGPHAPNVHTPPHTPQALRPRSPETPQRPAVPARTPSASAKPAAAKPARTTVKDRLVAAIDAHLKGEGDGKPLAGFSREQLRQVAKARGVKLDRGEHQDSIAEKLIAHASGGRPPEAPKANPKTPAAKAPAKMAKAATKPSAPAGSTSGDAAFSARSAGKDLLGSDPSTLASRVVERRASQHAADHDLAAIGHEQGFDGKPKVVSRAEMDRLVAAGNREVFRGVQGGPGGKSAADIQAEMRSGHAWYGLGIYGNGYYWGEKSVGTEYSDGTQGSVARAVLSPDAKVADFWKDLYPEHDQFLASLSGKPDEAQLREVYGDIGRYAAARGYDAIRINQQHGEPFFNVLNRTALVVEEAP